MWINSGNNMVKKWDGEGFMPSANPELFATVAKKDYLQLFDGERPKCHDVMEFIGFKKPDIAKATGVPLASVRWDQKMPEELRTRLSEWANLFNLVAEFFNGDIPKTARWFALSNPMLGNISPRDMIRFGRYKRLSKFIVNALSENRR